MTKFDVIINQETKVECLNGRFLSVGAALFFCSGSRVGPRLDIESNSNDRSVVFSISWTTSAVDISESRSQEMDWKGAGRGREFYPQRTNNSRQGVTQGTTINSRPGTTPPSWYLFDYRNDHPTQREVDAFFHQNPNPSAQEIVDILLRNTTWKKKKKIEVLTGNKLPFIMFKLQSMMSVFNCLQLRNATVGILESLQVVSPNDIETSGL